MNTNEWLRTGIRVLANECNCRREHGASGASHLEYVERKLRELLLEGPDDTPDPAHPDTARLDRLINFMVTEKEASTQEVFLVAPMRMFGLSHQNQAAAVRDCLDAAMGPKPKYRPWTPAEAIGKVVRCKGNAMTQLLHLITSAGNNVIVDGRSVPLTYLLQDYEQPDGTPCGVLVEGK